MASINDITLIVQTCGKFSDIWYASTFLVGKYWPKSVNKPIYTSDTGEAPRDDRIIFVNSGEGAEFPKRLFSALSLVKTKYVALILDDYFLYKPIDASGLSALVDYMDKKGFDYVQFEKSYYTRRFKKDLENPKMRINSEFVTYSVNLTPGVWKASSLIQLAVGNENSWKFEVALAKNAQSRSFLCGRYSVNLIPYIDGIRKGKFLRKALRFLKKNHLYSGNRGKVSPFVVIKIKMMDFLKWILPPSWIVKIKSKMRKRGHTFYSDSAE